MKKFIAVLALVHGADAARLYEKNLSYNSKKKDDKTILSGKEQNNLKLYHSDQDQDSKNSKKNSDKEKQNKMEKIESKIEKLDTNDKKD